MYKGFENNKKSLSKNSEIGEVNVSLRVETSCQKNFKPNGRLS